MLWKGFSWSDISKSQALVLHVSMHAQAEQDLVCPEWGNIEPERSVPRKAWLLNSYIRQTEREPEAQEIHSGSERRPHLKNGADHEGLRITLNWRTEEVVCWNTETHQSWQNLGDVKDSAEEEREEYSAIVVVNQFNPWIEPQLG